MKIQIKQNFKSLVANKEVELPDFCVLTGKNGSGKSHFLEALTQNGIASIYDENGSVYNVSDVKYIPFNGLNPQIDTVCNFSNLNKFVNDCNHILQEIVTQFKNLSTVADKNKWFLGQLNNSFYRGINSNPRIKMALKTILEKSGKDFDQLTEEDVRQYIQYLDFEDNTIFKGHFALIFKAYHVKYDDNEYKKYQNATNHTNYKVLSREQFVELNGPEPWEFVDGILKDAKIPYSVSNPKGTDRDSTFSFKLIDNQKGIEIQPSDLSTGEKVLMSLALAIYDSSNNNIKNKILLIDEPDAALHPEFSKFLLSTLKNHIVKKAGIKVIITTHSPTTVAMADEECLFEMDKKEKIPLKVSREKALSILTADIPSLRVSIDKRRIVFVESTLDAEYYEKIFEYLNSSMKLGIQPAFFAPHNREGTNCTDVVDLMSKLTGTDGVYGVIDYDNVNHSSGKVKVMGERGSLRYTKENYIFDPIFVGLAILRDGIEKRPDDLTIEKFNSASHECKQGLIDWVMSELNLNQGETVKYETMSNEKFNISRDWINHDGHELEDKIVRKWPTFERLKVGFRNKGGDAVKAAMLSTVIRDNWQYLSKDFEILFKSLI